MKVWDQYIRDVLDHRFPACTWVIKACQRHLNDLETAAQPNSAFRFDETAAQHAIDFFKFLKHSKGEWAGHTITLEPWEQFLLAMIFGWKWRVTGWRRFKTAYIEIARKNGKSTLGAGVGLYLMVGDGEPGAEVYTAATKRDQARITHSEAMRMVKMSPTLRKRIHIVKDNLSSIKDNASKFEPLGADADTMDGLNVHGAIIDEVHAHKNRDTWDALDTATGSRRQPLLFAITTAGYDRFSLCYGLHEYVTKLLDRMIEDNEFFGIIYTLDKEDIEDPNGWQNEANWIKANPNLGISKKLSMMRTKANKAREMPSALNSFLRLELNVWTQADTRWVPPDHWQACGKPVDPDGLRGRICYGGLDLSSNTDVTAFLLVFRPPKKGDDYQVLCRFWIPEESIHTRVNRDRVPYDVWVRQGFMTATPGNVVDYDYIMNQIGEDAEKYDLSEIAFDRWGATNIVQKIQEQGLTCVQFGQGFASMASPMRDLEQLLLSHTLAHANNPVLTWMAGNLVVEVDAAGNKKPSKERSTEKIDGMVALLMALDRAARNVAEKKSVYTGRGVRTL